VQRSTAVGATMDVVRPPPADPLCRSVSSVVARGRLAQLEEQLAYNQQVVGSSPAAPTFLPRRETSGGTPLWQGSTTRYRGTSTPGGPSTATRTRTWETIGACATGTTTGATPSRRRTGWWPRSPSPIRCRRSSRASCSSPPRPAPRTTSTGWPASGPTTAGWPTSPNGEPASARSSSTTSTTPLPTCGSSRNTGCAVACCCPTSRPTASGSSRCTIRAMTLCGASSRSSRWS
jgi:hypothetical protein